ncbi:hypothetical protein BDP67DRAFT_273263 [Colletotrichum lupini]|nr:hypothetical protein BDP67DRAFT_273263 [Colletotrichum lupini]
MVSVTRHCGSALAKPAAALCFSQDPKSPPGLFRPVLSSHPNAIHPVIYLAPHPPPSWVASRPLGSWAQESTLSGPDFGLLRAGGVCVCARFSTLISASMDE